LPPAPPRHRSPRTAQPGREATDDATRDPPRTRWTVQPDGHLDHDGTCVRLTLAEGRHHPSVDRPSDPTGTDGAGHSAAIASRMSSLAARRAGQLAAASPSRAAIT